LQLPPLLLLGPVPLLPLPHLLLVTPYQLLLSSLSARISVGVVQEREWSELGVVLDL
jgi:hypothetical protein